MQPELVCGGRAAPHGGKATWAAKALPTAQRALPTAQQALPTFLDTEAPLLLGSPDSLSGLADLLLSPLSPESPSGQPWGTPLPSALPRLTQPEVLADKACGQQVPALLSSLHTPHTSQYSFGLLQPENFYSPIKTLPYHFLLCPRPSPPHPPAQLGQAERADGRGAAGKSLSRLAGSTKRLGPRPPPALSSRGGPHPSPRASMQPGAPAGTGCTRVLLHL